MDIVIQLVMLLARLFYMTVRFTFQMILMLLRAFTK